MLLLFTDYGWQGPYVGQIKSVLHTSAPGVAVVDLMHDAPAFNSHAGAHLLSALARSIPTGSVVICVIDPGVGGERGVALVEADGTYYIGPDNGLLSVLAARARQSRVWHVNWRPDVLAASFHGRDLFAPVAARLASGDFPEDWLSVAELHVNFDSADLSRVLYVDAYGNAWTGIQGNLIDQDSRLRIGNVDLQYRRVFCEADKGEAFWYVNSAGLVEIAANRASAALQLNLKIGDPVRLSISPGSHLH